jgi:Asp-tRNA(Asn)/Glu-tRNA(Gln) amidotransferase A subunit family amidase
MTQENEQRSSGITRRKVLAAGLAAGAIILGKTQTSEFATFPRTKTLLAGEALNPWNTAHISVPCGFVDGLPVGLQIIGPRFADVKVMRAAQAMSLLQPWMDFYPPNLEG